MSETFNTILTLFDWYSPFFAHFEWFSEEGNNFGGTLYPPYFIVIAEVLLKFRREGERYEENNAARWNKNK